MSHIETIIHMTPQQLAVELFRTATANTEIATRIRTLKAKIEAWHHARQPEAARTADAHEPETFPGPIGDIVKRLDAIEARLNEYLDCGLADRDDEPFPGQEFVADKLFTKPDSELTEISMKYAREKVEPGRAGKLKDAFMPPPRVVAGKRTRGGETITDYIGEPAAKFTDESNPLEDVREGIARAKAAVGLKPMIPTLDFIFDGPPSREGPRLIEIEVDGVSQTKAGEWTEREDGLWQLSIGSLHVIERREENPPIDDADFEVKEGPAPDTAKSDDDWARTAVEREFKKIPSGFLHNTEVIPVIDAIAKTIEIVRGQHVKMRYAWFDIKTDPPEQEGRYLVVYLRENAPAVYDVIHFSRGENMPGWNDGAMPMQEPQFWAELPGTPPAGGKEKR